MMSSVVFSFLNNTPMGNLNNYAKLILNNIIKKEKAEFLFITP